MASQKTSPAPSVEYDDLVQAARLALLRAFHRWDPRRGTLNAFAWERIVGSMLDHLRDLDHMGRNYRRQVKAGKRVPVLLFHLGTPLSHASFAVDDIQLGDVLQDHDTPDLEVKCGHHEASRMLRHVIGAMSPRNRKIVQAYCSGALTMKEIGERVHINQSRVSQILKFAKRKMRVALEEKGIHSVSDFRPAA